MPRLPLNITMTGKHALVIGGGGVACRKLHKLLEAGADVHLVAPEVTPDITNLIAAGKIIVRLGTYEPGDLEGAYVVVAATNDREANRRIAADAMQRGLLVDVADAPDDGNCTFPAVLRRGDLEITVSTNGQSPAFASLVRDLIAGVIGEEYGIALERIAAEREKLLTGKNCSTYNKKIMHSLAKQIITELCPHKELL